MTEWGYCTLNHTVLLFCFSTLIAIRWPVKILRDPGDDILNTWKFQQIHSVMIDTLEVVWNFLGEILR